MLQIKPSKNMLIYLGIVAAVMLLICGFVYCNRSSKLGALEAKITDRRQKLEDSEKTAKQLSNIEQNYMDAQATLGTLEKGVSSKAYVPTLLRQLEELGKIVNLRVVSIRPKSVVEAPIVVNTEDGKKKADATPKADPYDKLDIDIEVNGKYWDTVNFIHKITSFPKIIVVKNVQVTPANQSKDLMGSPMLSVRLNTTAFILKETEEKAVRKSETRADVGSDRI